MHFLHGNFACSRIGTTHIVVILGFAVARTQNFHVKKCIFINSITRDRSNEMNFAHVSKLDKMLNFDFLARNPPSDANSKVLSNPLSKNASRQPSSISADRKFVRLTSQKLLFVIIFRRSRILRIFRAQNRSVEVKFR